MAGVEYVGLCDADPHKGKAMAARFGVRYLANLRVQEAIYLSHAQGRRIELENP